MIVPKKFEVRPLDLCCLCRKWKLQNTDRPDRRKWTDTSTQGTKVYRQSRDIYSPSATASKMEHEDQILFTSILTSPGHFRGCLPCLPPLHLERVEGPVRTFAQWWRKSCFFFPVGFFLGIEHLSLSRNDWLTYVKKLPKFNWGCIFHKKNWPGTGWGENLG